MNENLLVPLLILALILAFFAVVIYFAMKIYNRHKAAWRAFGERQGLTGEKNFWRGFDVFTGMFEGFPVRLTATGTSQGKSSDTNHLQIDMTVEIHGMPDQLEVYRETFVSKLGKVFHTQDIEVGDPQFDLEFKVKGKEPDRVRMYLMGARAQVIMEQLQGQLVKAQISAPGVKLHVDAHLSRPVEMDAAADALKQLLGFARALR